MPSNAKFSYCEFACVPEIPYIQDVLFAMGASSEQYVYGFCEANHRPYVDNIQMLVSHDKWGKLIRVPTSEQDQRRVIAMAIVDLCPEEAKSEFNTAYAKAAELLG